MKILINNEEVVCSNNFTIEEEMLSTSSVILNNVYPKTWESTKDYVSNFYYPEDYSKCLIYDGEQIDNFEILGATSQNGTPTPDNPIPIVNKTGTITETIQDKQYTFNLGDIELCKIGNYQDYIRKSSGKNLFDDTYNNLGMWQAAVGQTTSFGSSNNYLGAYCKVEEGKTYSISRKKLTNRFVVALCNEIPTTSSSAIVVARDDSAYKLENIQIQSGYSYLAIYLSNSGETSDGLDLQVEQGISATEYEPYGEVWYLHKEIGKLDMSTITDWGRNSNSDFYRVNFVGAYGIKRDTLYSNIFKYSTTTWESEMFGITSSNNLWIATNDNTIQSADNVPNWLANKNAVMYGILATPTDTEITDETLLNQLESVGYELIFAGVVENTGEISLNPRHPHFCNLQILDFKTFLSEGELDTFVIYQKTITEAINMIVNNISEYGFVVGNIDILNPNDIIGAYSTKDKTAYDMFQYIADITQSRWTTRMIDENTVAIDFYDPSLMPTGTPIEYTQEFFVDNDIHDMSFNYSSRDYRNKQVMTSDEVYSSITQDESITASGYQTQFPTSEKIGIINSITVNGTSQTFITNEEKELGATADFYYTPKNNYFESDDTLTAGDIVIINYTAIVSGRQIVTNQTEINRINTSTGRKGIVTRYENRKDATTSGELTEIGKSYIKYKGLPEITLTVTTSHNIWNIGDTVEFTAPLEELTTTYMVKKKSITYIPKANYIDYIYELTSSFNSETEINYFDNQRAKNSGNIGEGEYVVRNIDIENTANIIFYGLEVEEITTTGDNVLDSILDSPINN